MKLRYSQTSPFVRKALVVAHERGLAERIELVPSAANPASPDAELGRDNPLGKLPSLTLDDGSTLYDSSVIAEYLDSLGGAKLFPAAGPERWTALRQQALADGLLDAAVLVRYERVLRPADKRWPEWVGGQFVKVHQALDAFENEAVNLQRAVTIGTIAAACALGYLDFRFADDDWRASRPKLAAFFAKFSQRPSMAATKPPAN